MEMQGWKCKDGKFEDENLRMENLRTENLTIFITILLNL